MTTNANQKFPETRLRRLRGSETLRRMMQETRLSLDQFVMPYFVREGQGIKEAIESMPDQYRFSVDKLCSEIEELVELGINSVLLFGIPDKKDEKATSAWSRNAITQRAVREIKKNFPDLLVITDICLCAYTSHGHCGIVNRKGEIDNDATLPVLADIALSHAEAGADILAPSDMMDGRIRAIRQALDQKDFKQLPIMSYAAKYASAFYGPFRDAAHSSPQASNHEGVSIPQDRKTYQMDPSNRNEALREIALDLEEGADIVMIKPALAYLDVIREARSQFNVPIAAYAVSGEYSMIKAAASQSLLDEKCAVIEMMTGFARAGAGILITYYAKQIAAWNASTQLLSKQSVKTN